MKLPVFTVDLTRLSVALNIQSRKVNQSVNNDL